MKKTELKVGEHYAVGSSGRYDHWRHEHVELVELDGTAKIARYGWSNEDDSIGKTGIIAKIHGPGLNLNKPEWRRYGVRIIGREGYLFFKDARAFIELWEPYAARLAERNAGIKERDDEIERHNRIIYNLAPVLEQRGVKWDHNDNLGKITFTGEDAAKALGLTTKETA